MALEDSVREEMYGVQVEQRAYEAASTDYRIGNTGLKVGTSDEHTARELLYLQLRSWEAIRNNKYAGIGLNKWVQAIGTLQVNWVIASGKNKGKKHELMQSLWEEFCGNPSIDNIGDINNIQNMWKNSEFITGASFSRLRIQRKKNNNVVPLKLELIPTELHDPLFFEKNSRFGIQFDGYLPEKYFFRQDIYKDLLQAPTGGYKPHVAIDADDIIHGFKRRFPGQFIGVPELAPVLLTLYDLDVLTDATIAQQQAAKTIAIIIEQTKVTTPIAVGNKVTAYSQEAGKKKLKFDTAGGNVLYLGPGETATQFEVKDIGKNLQVLLDSELSGIATSLNIPFHEYTGNTTKLNFATIKALATAVRLFMIQHHTLVTIPMSMRPLAEAFKSYALLYNKSVGNAVPTFQFPRHFGTDDLKDAQADLLEIQSGMGLLSHALAERGITPEELEKDRALIKQLGLDDLLKIADQRTVGQSDNKEANSNSKG